MDLGGAKFYNATLTDAELFGADITNASSTNANWSGVILLTHRRHSGRALPVGPVGALLSTRRRRPAPAAYSQQPAAYSLQPTAYSRGFPTRPHLGLRPCISEVSFHGLSWLTAKGDSGSLPISSRPVLTKGLNLTTLPEEPQPVNRKIRKNVFFFVSSRRSGGQRARRQDRRRSADEPNLARRGPPCSRRKSNETAALAKSDSTAMPRRHGSFFVSSRRSGGQRARPLGDGNPVVNQKLRRTLRV